MEIDIRETAKVKSIFKELFAGSLNSALLSAAYKVQQVIVSELIPQTTPTPVDRGFYRAAWRVRSGIEDGQTFAEIVNDVKHALFIEYGVKSDRVRPGKAMHEALTEWVIRKGLAAGRQVMSDGSTRKKNKTTESFDAASMAYAIMMTLKKNGIFEQGEGLKIAKRAKERVPAIVMEELRAAVKDHLRRL